MYRISPLIYGIIWVLKCYEYVYIYIYTDYKPLTKWDAHASSDLISRARSTGGGFEKIGFF